MNEADNSTFSLNTNDVQCNAYHRRPGSSQAPDPDFIYNAQSRSGLFETGTTSRIKAIVYSGFDYSISICIHPIFGTGIMFQLTDEKTGEVFYDNKTSKLATHTVFSCQQTTSMHITVSVPDHPGERVQGCIGVLIEQRPSEKIG